MGIFLVVLSLFSSRVLGDEGLLNILVEFVQVDIGKHGTRYPSYNVAKKVLAFVYQVAVPRSHLRAAYGDGFRGAPIRCDKRPEEGPFARVPGAFDEQVYPQELQEIGGAEHV